MNLQRLALAALVACALSSHAYARSPGSGGNDRGGHSEGGKGGHGGHGGSGGHGHGGHGHGGHGHGGGKGGPEAPGPSGGPATEAAGPPGGPNDGPDTRGRGSYRLVCDRWPSEYWCQAGAPYVLPPARTQ